MAHRLTRFEKILVGGLIVTGVALAASSLSRGVDESPAGEVAEAMEATKPPPLREERFENQIPPIDFFCDDWFEGVSIEGEKVEGQVIGYPYGGTELRIRDWATDEARILPLARFPKYRITRHWMDESIEYQIRIVRPGGGEKTLYARRIEETKDVLLADLESGQVPIPRNQVRSVTPVRTER